MDNPKNILCIAFPLDEPEEQAVDFFVETKGSASALSCGLSECFTLSIIISTWKAVSAEFFALLTMNLLFLSNEATKVLVIFSNFM